MSNCVDLSMDYQNDAEVEVMDIIYQKNQLGFVDVLHGKFVVHIRRDHKDTELVITFFKCAVGATGTCSENPKTVIEKLDCQRFHNDQTGPWYMFAPAIDKRNMCVESKGQFDINGAKIEGRFFEKYMTVEVGHYRIKLLHHLPGETMDIKNLRGCIELDFDIYA